MGWYVVKKGPMQVKGALSRSKKQRIYIKEKLWVYKSAIWYIGRIFLNSIVSHFIVTQLRKILKQAGLVKPLKEGNSAFGVNRGFTPQAVIDCKVSQR